MDQQAELKQMLESIEAAKQDELSEAKLRNSVEEEPEEMAEVSYTPVDIYQKRANSRYEESKRVRPNGSSAVVNAAVKAVIDGDGVPGSGLSLSLIHI